MNSRMTLMLVGARNEETVHAARFQLGAQGSEARRALAGVALIVEGLEGLVHGRNLASGAFQDQRRPGAVPQGAEKNQPLAAIET